MSLPISLKLPNGFLDGEIREGYEVSPKLKKIWAVELDLLEKFSQVCRKYGLKYHVAYGTMLGAVRHKGFIPWDDDLDVWMLRDDYEKLASVAETEFRYPYFLQTALSDRKFLTMNPRLRNSRTTAIVKGNESPDYNNGIFMDIYILDGYTESRLGYLFQYWLIRFLKRVIVAYNRSGFWKVLRVMRYETLIAVLKRVRMMFNHSAKRFSTIGGFSKTGYRYALQKKDFDESIMSQYEFLQVPIPRNVEYFLEGEYGDWKRLPDESKRGKWHEDQIRFNPDVSYKEVLK